MKKILAIGLFFGMMSSLSVVYASEEAVVEAPAAANEAGGWTKAGDEIGEAAHAVGDATADSSKKAWNATKEGSAEAWDATKKGSKEAWDATKDGSAEAWDATKESSKSAWSKGKAKIHDATAPAPPVPEGD